MSTILTEVCVESVSGAGAAVRGGADRIELCAALELGGITPSAGLIEAVAGMIGTHVLIRPRGGDFTYDKHEIRVMTKDVEHAVDRGAASVVIGALTPAGDVDLPTMVRLLGAAGHVPVTFHRAFDSARDPLAALDDLMELGVQRLLTSGGCPTAAQGMKQIAEFVRRCGDDLCILAGSGIGPANVVEVVETTGVREIHFSARVLARTSTGNTVPVGPMDGGRRLETSADLVRATIDALSMRCADPVG